MTMNRNYQKSNEPPEDDPMTNLGGLDHITKRPENPTRIATELSGVSSPSGITPRPAPPSMMSGGFGSFSTSPAPPTFTPSSIGSIGPSNIGSISPPEVATKKPSWLKVLGIVGAVAGMTIIATRFIGEGDEGE